MALRTPLYDIHAAAGATFTEFAGFEMPVHYGSIKAEHAAVREAAGLFDVSHMSNLLVEGPGAAAAISHVCPFDAEALPDGKGKYSFALREDGTIVDDLFVFRLGPASFYVVPNAGQNHIIADHLATHGIDMTIEDRTQQDAILALQGPKARAILKAASDDAGPKFHRITDMTIAGIPCRASGTGYTGEKGCELYVPSEHVATVWAHLMSVGSEHGLVPVGLGARDTLRLEKGYCLAGNEFAGGRTPLEAGLTWAMSFDGEFLGKEALLAQQQDGHDTLWGLSQARGIPRGGYRVKKDGHDVGVITSGSQSPTLGAGIALAYLRDVQEGDAVGVEVRGRMQDATVVKPPFC